jgi:hypothetical protein
LSCFFSRFEARHEVLMLASALKQTHTLRTKYLQNNWLDLTVGIHERRMRVKLCSQVIYGWLMRRTFNHIKSFFLSIPSS